MNNEEKYKRAKELIYGQNVNVTESNILKEFFKVCVGTLVFMTVVYFSVYTLSGIVISLMTPNMRQNLESSLSLIGPPNNTTELGTEDSYRLAKIKKDILSVDKNFPKTSTFKFGTIKSHNMNAFCYPDGTIYVTTALLSKLKSDEELTFIIAHEMGHYRHKDGLLSLRRNIAGGIVVLCFYISGGDTRHMSVFTNGALGSTQLKFSRNAEEKADKYAIRIIKRLYGNTNGGVRAMKTLEEYNGKHVAEFLSTHPDYERRIKYIQNEGK